MQKTIRRVTIDFNRNTEPELVEWIEDQESKAGYIKRLVLEDMQRAKANTQQQ